MSHIFVSYYNEDADSRDILINTLKANGFDGEIWWDQNIKAGSHWIKDIDTALDEAYCLIVIATPKSMKSRYVTYEWSSMLGSNTPVFPLLFKGEHKHMHPRLVQLMQVVDCRKGIPNSLIEDIRAARSTPPEIDFLNQKISTILLPFRVAALVTLWCYEQIKNHLEDDGEFALLVDGMLEQAGKVSVDQLPDFITSRAAALHSNQYRICRELLLAMDKFWHLFREPTGESVYHTASTEYVINAAPLAIDFYGKTLMPLINYFTTKNFQEEAFVTLETGLAALKQGSLRFERVGYAGSTEIIDMAFGEENEYAIFLKNKIQQVVDRLARKP